MLRFILNDKLVESALPSGSTVLDFVRYHKRMAGTKIGCREGDCGACTILVGDMEAGKLVYRSMTSCLMPLANAHGKHIVSVEGINLPGISNLSPVQQAMVDCNGTQCGFCTPGFIMSLTGFVLNDTSNTYQDAVKSIDGNICRCTGYKSIERAAASIAAQTVDKPGAQAIGWLVENNFIPAYFSSIEEKIRELKRSAGETTAAETKKELVLAGGTDLVVQKALTVKKSGIDHVFDKSHLQEISFQDGRCYIGGAVTVTAFAESELIRGFFPQLPAYMKLISSTPIRNMATMAGNLVNASPIGDMSIFFLALDSELLLNNNGTTRTTRLKDLYKGYKQLDKEPGEIIEKIIFTAPRNNHFNFEKVSKRMHLDIATVNSGCQLTCHEDGSIAGIHLSAGGVAPFPKYLSNTVAFLTGKQINAGVLKEAIKIMNAEVAPISDARGTKEYKRLLLRQLFLAHFSDHRDVVKTVLGI